VRRLRSLLLPAVSAVLVGAGAAHADIYFFPPGLRPAGGTATPMQVADVRITAGQSWTTNFFTGMAADGYYQMPGIVWQPGLNNGNFPSGILPISAGINLPATLSNTLAAFTPAAAWPVPGKSLDSGDGLSIGRTSLLALQLLRQAGGVPMTPVIEFNNGCPSSSWVSGPCGGLGSPTATFTGTQSAAILTVASVSGTIIAGQWVAGTGVTAEQVQAFGTAGTSGAGGNGTYSMTVSQSVGPVAMAAQSGAWRALGAVTPAIAAALPSQPANLQSASYKSVLWVQGGSFDLSSPAPTVTEWTAMTVAYDALNLPGAGTSGLLFYVPIRAPNSDDTKGSNAILGGVQFVRDNANGRTIGACPWYQWPFTGNDNIHLGDYGTRREGECVALAQYITEVEGNQFKPLWRSRTKSITRGGQVLTVPFDRPVGSFFTNAQMTWMSDPQDGIKIWPQLGFHVRRAGIELTVTPTIVDMTVQLAIAEAITPGDVLEVSYAFYGPGGPNPGNNTGVGGNLMMPGPPSSLFPGTTINSWAWPFLESVAL